MTSIQVHQSEIQRGRMLLETLLSGALVAVLLAQALPAVNQLLLRQRLQAAAQLLMTDLQQARAEAVRGADTVQFAFNQPAGGTCYVIHTGAVGACRCETEGQAICAADASVIKTVWLPANRSVTVRANVRNLSFHARQGTVTSTGSVDLDAGTGASVRHVVSIAGRVRSCTPSGSIAGLKACQG